MTGDGEIWTEIEWVELAPAERAETAPEETRAVPYVVRARGFAVRPELGKQVEIRTVTGRPLHGRVTDVYPGYHHTFGRPLAAWIIMRDQIRASLSQRNRDAAATVRDSAEAP